MPASQYYSITDVDSQIQLEIQPLIMLFSVDVLGNVKMLEGNLTEQLGLKSSEVIGANIFKDFSSMHQIFGSVRRALTHRLSSYTFRLDKNFYKFYLTLSKNDNSADSNVHGIIIDVTEQKRIENIIVKKNDHVKLLFEATKALSTTLDVSQLYKILFDIISQVAGCDLLLVTSYDKERSIIQSTHLQVKSVDETIDVSHTPAIPLAPVGEGIMSRVIRSGETLVIDDHEKYDVQTKLHFTIHQGGVSPSSGNKLTGSSVIVPMKIMENVIGAVRIHNETANAYSSDTVEFIESLMHPLSLAVNNALLYGKAQKDISDRIDAENKLIDLLSEKESLLKEIHHRVRNNLQLILALLNFQTKYIKDDASAAVFKESISRIKAISLIQDKLYGDPSLTKVDFTGYLKSLVRLHRDSYELKKNNICFNVKSENIFMNIDTAVPAGLIVNELIINSIEKTFPADKQGEINIEMSFENSTVNKYTLKIKDNATGMPTNYNEARKQSLGMSIMNNLSKQLNGTLEFNIGEGTDIIFQFPSSEYTQRI